LRFGLSQGSTERLVIVEGTTDSEPEIFELCQLGKLKIKSNFTSFGDVSVIIAIDYGIDGQGSISSKGKKFVFPPLSRVALESTLDLISGCRGVLFQE
jgi:hypothetical protein